MKIIIVGAGLGGLTAAFCFARKGHDVHVLEHRPSLSPTGSGINIRACATRILHAWGLEKELEAISDETPTAVLRNLYTGTVATRNVMVDISQWPEWGTTRQELIELFYKVAVDSGARIEFNRSVTGVYDKSEDNDSEQAVVVLDDGSKLTSDLVLVADGMRSRLRATVLSDVGSSIEPIVDNIALYGVAVQGSLITGNPQSRSLADDANINCWLGEDGFVVGRYHHRSDVWRGSFIIKSNHDTDTRMWDEHGDIGYVRAFFSSSCPQIVTALRLATACDRWKLGEMPDLPRWTSKQGRIALLGDSAHGMHPNAAQGYSQIVEDISVLEYLISNSSASTSRIPSILSMWQSVRKERVERIKAYSRWNTAMFLGSPSGPQTNNGPSKARSLRNVRPDPKAPFHSSAFNKWALDHDVLEEVGDTRMGVCGLTRVWKMACLSRTADSKIP